MNQIMQMYWIRATALLNNAYWISSNILSNLDYNEKNDQTDSLRAVLNAVVEAHEEQQGH